MTGYGHRDLVPCTQRLEQRRPLVRPTATNERGHQPVNLALPARRAVESARLCMAARLSKQLPRPRAQSTGRTPVRRHPLGAVWVLGDLTHALSREPPLQRNKNFPISVTYRLGLRQSSISLNPFRCPGSTGDARPSDRAAPSAAPRTHPPDPSRLSSVRQLRPPLSLPARPPTPRDSPGGVASSRGKPPSSSTSLARPRTLPSRR